MNGSDRRHDRGRALLGLSLSTLVGCGAMTGGPSLTLLARSDLSRYYEPIADVVEVQECGYNVLFLVFFGNARPTHEGVIALALEKYDAEVILDAEISSTTYPYFIYNQRCTTVRGTPARRRLTPLPPPGPETPPPDGAGARDSFVPGEVEAAPDFETESI